MALNCKNPNAAGKSILAEFSAICGDVDPRTATFQPIGSMRGKDFTFSADTIDTTADDSVSAKCKVFASHRANRLERGCSRIYVTADSRELGKNGFRLR